MSLDHSVVLASDELGPRVRMWRENRRLTQDAVARALGIARTTVVAIEAGQRRLRPEELVQLAEFLGQSVSELVRREVEPPGFVAQLEAAGRVALPAEVLPAVAELEALGSDYVKLEELCGAVQRRAVLPLYEAGAADPEAAAEDAAVAERARLGLGDGPLFALREVLEAAYGLRVFQLDMPAPYRGLFARSEALGVCVALRREQPPRRQRAVLAQVAGVLVAGRPKAGLLLAAPPARRAAADRYAEAFGHAFLMPQSGLRRRFLDLVRERAGAPTNGDLVRLALAYGVPIEALALRLEALHLISVGTWERLKKRRVKVAEVRPLLDAAPREDERLPSRYIALAVEAWQRGELSEGQLAQFLRLDRLAVRALLEQQQSLAGEEVAGLDLTAPFLAVR